MDIIRRKARSLIGDISYYYSVVRLASYDSGFNSVVASTFPFGLHLKWEASTVAVSFQESRLAIIGPYLLSQILDLLQSNTI